MSASHPIDWSIFDGDPEQTCGCRCGHIFRSHAKLVMGVERPHSKTRKPCPACGRDDNCDRLSSDPEPYSIGGDDE